MVRSWIAHIGYDVHFHNRESRAFNLTIHSIDKFEVTQKDALYTDLDSWANAAIALRDLEVKGT